MTCLNSLVPQVSCSVKLKKVIDFTDIYGMAEQLYCDNNSHPAVDPVVHIEIVGKYTWLNQIRIKFAVIHLKNLAIWA